MLTLSTVDLTSGLTPSILAQALVGSGVTVSNVKFTGNLLAAGQFKGGIPDGLGIEAGVMLSSGKVSNAIGPNTSDAISAGFGLPGDADLNALIPGFTTHDAAVLEFDFAATGGSISFQYVFGSDEYNEFVNQPFNDVFGFFLDGKNIALIPGTTTPVSINNVNQGKNSKFFRNNDPSDLGIPTPFPTQADGFTAPLQASAIASAGTHHIKLAIADAGDTALDSWVFLANQSFVSGKADLGITNVDSPDPVAAGNMLTYTLVATNHGPDKANGVIVQDILPAGVTFVGATTSQGAVFQAGGFVTASMDSLASGASDTITVTVIPNVLGTITNTATVQAFQVDDVPENNTASQDTTVTRFKVTGVNALEGNSGLTDFVISIVQGPGHTDTKIMSYGTVGGSATAGSDYIPQSGTLTFAPGDTQKFVTIKVIGDTKYESDETFGFVVSDAANVNLDRAQDVSTIINDDTGVLINDVTVLEGDAGTQDAVFTVSLVGAIQPAGVTVAYSTVSDTAQAGSDFLFRSGVLTFAPGTVAHTISVPIVGDLLNELTEDFFVNLSNGVNVEILRNPGIGTIPDNDPAPYLIVNDVHVTTTKPGEVDAVFAVALNLPSGQDVTVQYATADGVVKANINNSSGNDTYSPTSGTLDFPAGVTKQLVTVPVQINGSPEPNETFSLNLTNPVHAKIFYPQGIATVIFADPPPSEFIIDDGEDGYRQTDGWTNTTNTLAYHLDYDFHAPGNGQDTATWTFADIAPITYQVFVRWSWFSNRATNAPYTIYDGTTPEGTVPVNEQVAPAGDISDGITWQSLGMFQASTGTLVVKLGDNANGYVIADAVRIVAHGISQQVPEMDVGGTGQSIADGARAPIAADGTDFGGVPIGTDSPVHTYTITNTGNADLHLSGSPPVRILGANPQDFIIVAEPSAAVAGGANTTFQVVFHPSFPTTQTPVRQAIISIDNDDASEHPYTFEVQGTADDTSLNHNAALPQDVNGDQSVTSSDLLAVVNRLMSQSVSSASSIMTFASAAAAPASGSGKTYFCDVNGDGSITPSDALMVINYLFQHGNAQGASAPAAQGLTSASNSSAVQTFSAVDQAQYLWSEPTATATGPSAGAAIAIAPTTAPISPPPTPIVTLSPAAVRLIFASSVKKSGAQADSPPGELEV